MHDSSGNVESPSDRDQPLQESTDQAQNRVCSSSALSGTHMGEMSLQASEKRYNPNTNVDRSLLTANTRNITVEEFARAAAANERDGSTGDVGWNSLPTNVALYKHVVGRLPGHDNSAPQPSSAQSSQFLPLADQPLPVPPMMI